MIPTLATLAAALVLSAPAVDDELWTDDFTAAQTRARAESKDLLLDFTGSDWCAWCIRLHREVFEQDAFEAAAPEQYVLVTLDFPRDTSRLSEAVQRQNEGLRERYPIAGFPTLYLLDAEGRPYATTGYREGGAEPYLEHLARLRRVREARDSAWAAMEVEGATPAERASAMDRGLRALDERLLMPHYRAEIEALAELDAEDAQGLATRARFLLDPALLAPTLDEIQAVIAERGEAADWQGLVDAMAQFAARYRAVDAVAQLALFYQGIGELELDHKDVGRALLERALGADGDGRHVRRIREVLEALDAEQARQG